MKFGENLRERSAPQWAIRESIKPCNDLDTILICLVSENIDYDDLKRIIKDRTTSSQNQPRFIPGQGNEAKALKEFEKELYDQLLEQHERVSRFVRSKGDELARRLGTTSVVKERTLAHLCSRFREASGSIESASHFLKEFQNFHEMY